ncbi:MAG: hypothetical protein H5U04_13305 [Firmicutes bacterium]|nr:hypothetical protein [Bacillota bacterium]
MIIVSNLGSNVNEYRALVDRCRSGDREALRLLPRSCPNPKCGRRLHGHGWSTERKGGLRLHRVLCRRCKKTHVVLPWFLAPHRPHEMDPVDQAFRLRVQGHSWYQVADAIAEFSLATIRRWIRRIHDLADKVVAILSRDARRLDPELHLDTLLRPFTGDRLKLLDAAIAAFWLACRRIDPSLDFPASRPLAWCNVYLSTAAPATGTEQGEAPIWL